MRVCAWLVLYVFVFGSSIVLLGAPRIMTMMYLDKTMYLDRVFVAMSILADMLENNLTNTIATGLVGCNVMGFLTNEQYNTDLGVVMSQIKSASLEQKVAGVKTFDCGDVLGSRYVITVHLDGIQPGDENRGDDANLDVPRGDGCRDDDGNAGKMKTFGWGDVGMMETIMFHAVTGVVMTQSIKVYAHVSIERTPKHSLAAIKSLGA